MESKKHSSDKRGGSRIRVNLEVVYRVNRPIEVRMQVGEEEVRASMLDLSQGGMAVLTTYKIPRASELAVSFKLIPKEGHSKSVSVVGEVCYNIELIDKQFRLGIRFTRIEEHDRTVISSFIKALTTD
jgi:c-di-GMP-binding flagellar brake protein YcgR